MYEKQPKICRIAYCPSGNRVIENDFKVISFARSINAELTIISDRYQIMADAYPEFVHWVPDKYYLTEFKKAHLVIAAGYKVVCALALCKSCLVLGDYGLGGLVTPDNYEQLQSVFFNGRKGGCSGEIVPIDLLSAEFSKAFFKDRKEDVLFIQKQVLQIYDMNRFFGELLNEIERIMDLFFILKKRVKRLYLKPFLSSVFRLEESNGKQYIMRGMQCFGEIEEEISDLLKQCDGVTSVHDLIKRYGYDKENAAICWDNLYELWKEKLILFNL